LNSRGLAIINYAPFIGLRYSFSRKRNRFTSVIALVSMLGMVLGVTSLIVVLSVMNGFSGELRGRILSLVAHGYVEGGATGISQWQSLSTQIETHPEVLAVSPYITDKVILGKGRVLRGAVLTAIDPAKEKNVSDIPDAMLSGSLQSLDEGSFNVVLGVTLARMLGVDVGDRVDITLPRLTVTPLGIFPRTKRLTVKESVDGLQVKTTDLFGAPQTMAELARELPQAYVTRDWSQTQGSLFNAVRLEKIMVSLLLLSVVAVAAFNIVSTLVMSVAEKRRDIAVLRTMGARSGGIMAIFVAHGLGLATVGIGAGCIAGVLLATHISDITIFIESVLGVKLFDPSVYFISELPSDLQWGDVMAVVVASLSLSLLATLYPAWRAASIAPAEVLRYE